MPRVLRLCLVLVFSMVACNEGGPTTPGPDTGDGQTPAIAVSVSPASLTLPQAGSGDIAIVLTRSGGYVGEIELTLAGAPAGVSASFAPATVTAGGSASVLTLAVGGSVPAGTYGLEVRANGNGVAQKTITISLTVTAVTTPGFTLAVAPQMVSIPQGSAASAIVSIARTGGFSAAVNLAVTGTPAGVNATLSPSFILVDPATLSIGATFNAPLGSFTLTVTASATGMTSKSATVTVQVTPSNPVGEVAYQFCPASGLPLWFAYQDGAGPWTRVTGINDIYAFDLVSNVGGVAWAVRTAGGGYDLHVFHASQQELTASGQQLCAGSRNGRTLHGTVAGLGVSDQAWISFGDASTVVLPATGSAFTLNNVISGTFDLMASSITIGGAGQLTLNKLLLRRGLNPADGTSFAGIDFSSAEAFNAVGQTIAVDNVGSDLTRVIMAYQAAGRRLAPYFADPVGVAGATRTYPGVPASRQVAGDLHVLNLVATPPGAGAPATTRSATVIFGAATSLATRLGPTVGPVTVSVPSVSPYARLRAQFMVQPSYANYFVFSLSQNGAGGLDRAATMAVTAAYLGSFSSVDITLPDFAGTGGWDAAFGPRAGVATQWLFSASGWLFGGGIDGPPLVDGVQAISASRTGTITP